jgi:acyl-CoA synthetase (AMP-forming)/AMP-acid ligase II
MRLHDFFDYRAREGAHYDFAIMGERHVTYEEAARDVNRIANALVASGLQPGDRVAILSKNSIEYVLLYYGASKAGVVPVPVNYRLAPPEWSYIINDAEAKAVFASPMYVDAVDGFRGDLKHAQSFIVLGGAAEGWRAYADWIALQPVTPPAVRVTNDDDVYQMYTSGTTGNPKGAVLTHHAVTSQIAQVSPIAQMSPGERVLVVAPLYHAAAAMTTFSSVAWGATLYIQEDFNPVEVVRALDEEQISVALLVPAMIQALLVFVPDVAKREYRDLREIIYGASPIAEATLRRAVEVFKCDFAQAYGMTETTAALTALLPSHHRQALEGRPELLLSAGRPLPGVELRAVDENDNPVPPGTVGEIVGRGDNLMRGYWNLPDESAEALRGGWMHTGDAGYIDEDGFVYIQDRVKDMIVSGGENVYPRHVEDVIFQHPAVADVAVIGVPDPVWGETVKAVVVLKQGQTATADEIMQFCEGKLGGFERPRSVDFVDALPRNASGKVLKKELRAPYWQGQKRGVAGS